MLGIVSFGRNMATRARAGSHRKLVEHEFAALLSFLRDSSCTFHSCEALIRNPVPRGVSFRYDIHLRDVPGCAAFIDIHKREQLPGTFFLLWDYSQAERRRFADFARLAGRIAPPLEIGLHDSPVDAYLIEKRFGEDRTAYIAWIKSAAAVEWFSSLLRAPDELAKLNLAVLEHFRRRVDRTTERFGAITAVASHGGEMNQAFRPKMQTLEKPLAELAHGLGRTWLTPERVTAAGLSVNVDGHGEGRKRWHQQSDLGGNIVKMAERLKRFIVGQNNAVQILIHPYTWSGGKRDGELSALLRQ